ncbi:MAG TPA: endonuclease VII domain-containing protein [Acidimicrobiales bacterium]|nr:endonuclease VII domain-containing protein [Acidimicrobiales bacterium]
MKRCRICNELKPLSDFYRAAGTRDGHRTECKQCNLAQQHERYLADPERAKARVKRWQQENADRVNAYWRERRQEPEVKRRDRAGHLWRKFGITIAEYDAMLAAQGGVCAVCKRPPTPGISLHVDHDHETGRIRGLLCFRCNNALGDLEDDPALLRAAARYLEALVPPDPAVARRLEELRSVQPAWELA